jgi:DNA-binding MarR family transcriptional regulator
MSIKEREYRLLEAISKDEGVTQASLAAKLGMAVGSVNWYVKRLISRGYLKATRMDRTRLRYNLTSEGMAAFTRNATQYMRDSLRIYRDFRSQAQEAVTNMKDMGIEAVCLQGQDEIMDIMRLTCIEAGIGLLSTPDKWVVRLNGNGYEVQDALGQEPGKK